MTGEESANSWQSVRHLLGASRSRIEVDHSHPLLLSASVALVNLFLCVLFENPIKDDQTGRTLSTFFILQGMAIFFLTLANMSSATAGILRKSSVMPLRQSARLTFAVVSSARHPVLLALIFADVFFLLVMYHQSAVAIVAIPLLMLLMAADIVTLTSLATAAAIRRSRPPTIVAAYGILGILGVLAATLLFHMPSALGALPPMSWTTRGIVAITSGELGLALLCGAASVALLLLTAILGRRFV